MRKIIVALFITGFWGVATAQTQDTLVLTLEKALEIAYEQSPQLIQTKMSLERSELNLVSRRASLKPRFNFDLSPFNYSRGNSYDEYTSRWYDTESMSASGGFSISQPLIWTDGQLTLRESLSWNQYKNETTAGKNTSYNNNLTLSLSQPLFHYNEQKQGLKEIEMEVQRSKISYAVQQLSIEQSVTQAFYQLYASYKSWQTQQEAYDNQLQTYEMNLSKEKAGLLAREELLQSQISLSESETTLLNQESSFITAKDEFKKQLGLPLNVEFTLDVNIEVEPIIINPETALDHALRQSTELRLQELSMIQNEMSLVQAKATNEFRGDINASVGLSGRGEKFKDAFKKPSDTEQIGLTITIPVIDWGQRKATIRRAQLSIEDTRISYEEQKKSIEIDIRSKCRDLPKTYKQIEIAKQRAENAQITYELNYQRYLNGTISGIQLKEFQKQLNDAKDEVTNKIITYKQQLLALKIATFWDFETNESILPADLYEE